jgi:hypothetical protein
MKRRWDGSIQSHNAPTQSKVGVGYSDNTMYRCMITEILYSDDPNNVTKNAQNPEVVYSAVILGGLEQGQVISNIRLGGIMAGDYNYWVHTLRATSKDISKDALEKHDGDCVMVQFIQGHDSYPQIICMSNAQHSKYGTKKADGPQSVREYNGVMENIDNKGNITVTRKGGTLADGAFTAKDIADVSYSLTESAFTVTTSQGVTFKVDGKNGNVSTTNGTTKVTMDGKNNNIKIISGSTEVDIDGASGKITLKGEMVELGASVSDFVTMFTALASAFNSHTHLVPQAPAGTLPSQPPTAPLLSSVGSQTVKVQP